MSTGSINIDKAFKNVVGEFGHRQKLYCLFLSLTNCYYAFQVSQLSHTTLQSINNANSASKVFGTVINTKYPLHIRICIGRYVFNLRTVDQGRFLLI